MSVCLFACLSMCSAYSVCVCVCLCVRVTDRMTALSIIYINSRFIKRPKRRLGSEMRGGVCAADPSILLAGDKTRRSGRRVTERALRGNRESLMRERESQKERERESEGETHHHHQRRAH